MIEAHTGFRTSHYLDNLMKKFSLKPLCAAVILGAGSEAAMAADGEINFTGKITDNTCAVTVNDLNSGAGNTVNLGDVSTKSLDKANAVAGGGGFTLAITGCDLTQLKTASVRLQSMSGTAGPNGQWIGINTGSGAATNVAVQIKDFSDKDVQLGMASTPYDVTQPLRFTTNYIATGVATPGTVNAKASFTVEYQ